MIKAEIFPKFRKIPEIFPKNPKDGGVRLSQTKGISQIIFSWGDILAIPSLHTSDESYP